MMTKYLTTALFIFTYQATGKSDSGVGHCLAESSIPPEKPCFSGGILQEIAGLDTSIKGGYFQDCPTRSGMLVTFAAVNAAFGKNSLKKPS